MKLSNDEIVRIKKRIAKCERRIAKGYVPKGTGETEQARAARLAALLP